MDYLDFATTLLGFLYIWLEYRASIWLWVVGIIMPAADVILYWNHGLYGDAGMAVYYTLAAVYGFVVWLSPLNPPLRGEAKNQANTNNQRPTINSQEPRAKNNGIKSLFASTSPLRGGLRGAVLALLFLFIWAAVYYILVTYTDSTVPLQDSFTNALSIVALWALAHKYIEQWLLWIVVDGVCCYLYIIKGIPFKAFLYGVYVIIAVAGYFRWRRMMRVTPCS